MEINLKRISQIDKEMESFVRLSAKAALQAYPTYTDEIQGNPILEGYTFKTWFLGATPFTDDVNSEPFVAVFCSDKNPKEWLLAFKGSATVWDWWKDIDFTFANFSFFEKRDSTNLYVEQGFKDIYVTPVSEQLGSLQKQLFDFIIESKLTKLIIAGHSLGSALAEMFTYDLLKCSSTVIPKEINHINFACPKVFNYDAALDLQQSLGKNLQVNVLRVVNKHDIVPNLPIFGEEMIGCYYHATDYFLYDFWKKDEVFPDCFYVYHSIINYRNVINKINLQLPISNPQTGECEGVELVESESESDKISLIPIILKYQIPS